MARRPTKTEMKQQAEALRVRVVKLFGEIAAEDPMVLTPAQLEARRIADELVKKHVCFGSFAELLRAWPENRYRPTLSARNHPEIVVLADLYDFFQARAGQDVVAFRG